MAATPQPQRVGAERQPCPSGAIPGWTQRGRAGPGTDGTRDGLDQAQGVVMLPRAAALVPQMAPGTGGVAPVGAWELPSVTPTVARLLQAGNCGICVPDGGRGLAFLSTVRCPHSPKSP